MRSWHVASRARVGTYNDDRCTVVATATASSRSHHCCGWQHAAAACVFDVTGSHRLMLIVMASCHWLMLVRGRAGCMMILDGC